MAVEDFIFLINVSIKDRLYILEPVYVTALKNGLSKNFETVEVDVVDCPDLRKKPFNLASQGECSVILYS